MTTLREAATMALEHIGHTPHGDNCFLCNHYDGDPGNQCNCGKDAMTEFLEAALAEQPAAPVPTSFQEWFEANKKYIHGADVDAWCETAFNAALTAAAPAAPVLTDAEFVAALTEAKELADSEGTRAVEYLRRARKAEAEVEALRKDAERFRSAVISIENLCHGVQNESIAAHNAAIDAAMKGTRHG